MCQGSVPVIPYLLCKISYWWWDYIGKRLLLLIRTVEGMLVNNILLDIRLSRTFVRSDCMYKKLLERGTIMIKCVYSNSVICSVKNR